MRVHEPRLRTLGAQDERSLRYELNDLGRASGRTPVRPTKLTDRLSDRLSESQGCQSQQPSHTSQLDEALVLSQRCEGRHRCEGRPESAAGEAEKAPSTPNAAKGKVQEPDALEQAHCTKMPAAGADAACATQRPSALPARTVPRVLSAPELPPRPSGRGLLRAPSRRAAHSRRALTPLSTPLLSMPNKRPQAPHREAHVERRSNAEGHAHRQDPRPKDESRVLEPVDGTTRSVTQDVAKESTTRTGGVHGGGAGSRHGSRDGTLSQADRPGTVPAHTRRITLDPSGWQQWESVAATAVVGAEWIVPFEWRRSINGTAVNRKGAQQAGIGGGQSDSAPGPASKEQAQQQ